MKTINNSKIIATIVTMGLLSIAIIPSAMAAMPNMDRMEQGIQYATENAQILRELTTMINDCTADVESYQFKMFDKCLTFMGDYNTMLKQMQAKYPETKGATSGFSSGLTSQDIQNLLQNQYLN